MKTFYRNSKENNISKKKKKKIYYYFLIKIKFTKRFYINYIKYNFKNNLNICKI